MKNLILLTILEFITMPFIGFGQQTYFEDAKVIYELRDQLSKISVESKNGQLSFKNSDAEKLMAPFITLLEKFEPNETDTYSGEPPQQEAPSEGQLSPIKTKNSKKQSPEKPKEQRDKTTSVLTQTEIDNLKEQLLAAAWLLQTNKETDLLQVKNFPRKFDLLVKIKSGMSKNFGQSDNGNSSFAFNETAIIYGLTDFIIKRAKEQLVNVYLQNWYDKLSKDEISSRIISQTLDVTKAFIDDEGLSYAKYGDKWKAAIREDFQHLPILIQDEDFVGKVISKFYANISPGDKTQLVAGICGGAELAYRLSRKEHIRSIVSSMASSYVASSSSPGFKKATVLADVLLDVAGTFIQNERYETVDIHDLQDLKSEEWGLVIKLTYARNNRQLKYVFEKSKTFDDFSNAGFQAHIDQFQKLLKGVVNTVQNFQAILSKNTASLEAGDIRRLMESAFELAPVCVDFLDHYKIVVKAGIYSDKIVKQFRFTMEMGEGLASQEYGKVLDGALGIMNTMKEKWTDDNTTISNLQRYGSFLLNILGAKESGEVETALEELIPKGSYQLKNSKKFVVSVYSTPGILIGVENIKKYKVTPTGSIDPSKEKENQGSFSASPYLPIGIDFSFHTQKREKLAEKALKDKFSSMNVGLQFFDLGAVFNYRLKSDSTVENSPEISFRQLFSPGLQLMWHFNNSPLVLGAAFHYTPDLRKINQDGITYEANAVRFGIFLGVDVTFINLFTSKKSSWTK